MMKKHPSKFITLREVLACGLILMGTAVALIGTIIFQNQLPLANAACTGQNLYLGSYYLLPDDGSHPDFEQVLQRLQDVPGQLQLALLNGLPVPISPNPPLANGQPTNTSIRQFDWYTPQYQVFTRLDSNPLAFSNDNVPNTTPYFGPGTQPAVSTALPANKDLFTVQWHGNLVVPGSGLTIPYAFALDDAGWVFLDGQLKIDHGGIHPPATFNGNFVIPPGQHTIDIFYADRHTLDAVTNFQLGNLGALLACGSPNLNLVKSVTPNNLVNPGDLLTYTVQVSNTGNFTATNVIIRDTTPGSTSYVSATPAPVTAPAVGGTGDVSWNLGTLLPGQSTNVSFVVRVNPNTPPAVAISNSAFGTSNESGGVVFKSNGVSNLVNAAPVLLVNKTAAPPPGSTVNVGDNITYTINVSNPGNVPTTGITVQDPLPPGTLFVSANPAPQSQVNNQLRWVLPGLAPGASRTITLVLKVITRLPAGLVQNQANAQSGSATASSPVVSHNVQDAADSSINKFVQNITPPGPIAAGSTITYRLEASNAGPSTALSVVVSDTLPAGVNLVNSSPPPTTVNGGNLSWNLGDYIAGQTGFVTLTIQIPVTYTGPLNFSNSSAISSGTPEIEPANNTSVVDVPGNAAPVDATIIKSGPPVIAPGQVFVYHLLVSTTLGGNNIVVSDTLPSGLTLVPEQTTPPPLGTGPTYTWNLGHMNPGQQREILLAVRAAPGLTPGTSLTNGADVSGGDGPTRAVSSTSSTTTQVAQASNLSISKASPTSQFTPGGTVDFVIRVRNNNAVTASGGLTVTDTLLPGFTLISSAPPATVNIVGGVTTLSWRVTSVPAGGTTPLNFTVQIPANYNGPTVSNSASLETDTPNTDPTITSDPVVIPRVGLTANLVLGKDSLTASVRRGQVIAYTISVSNTGPVEAHEVVIQDPLPPGLTYVSAQPAPTSNNPLTWNLGTLAANNGSASITLLVQVSQNFSGPSVANSASVTTVSGNSNQGNSTVVKTIPIQAPPASATPAVTAIRTTPGDVSTPTPTVSVSETPAVTETTTVGLTTTPETTPTLETVATTVASGSDMEVTPTVAAVSLPGLPNTGSNAPPSDGRGWPGWLISLTIALLLIGAGVRILLAHRK